MTRPRILCVDDSKALRMGMKNLLQAKFDVVGAGDGVEALKILTTESFDLIILDLDMPKLNGAQTIAQLRDREDSTPVILLTAEARTSHIKRVMEYGVLDYILKPCSPQDLVPKIEEALHKASQQPSLSMPSSPASRAETPTSSKTNESAPKAASGPAPGVAPKRVEPTISGPTVLLIDDMKSVGSALKRFVKDTIRIDQVLSESSTLQAIAKRQYQAVVVDVELPIADIAGWLGRLRLQQPLASYIALGLPTREDLPQWSKKSGFDDYLYKPFLEDEVRRFVMTHVDEKRKMIVLGNLIKLPVFHDNDREKELQRFRELTRKGLERVASTANYFSAVMVLEDRVPIELIGRLMPQALDHCSDLRMELRVVGGDDIKKAIIASVGPDEVGIYPDADSALRGTEVVAVPD